MKRCPVGSREYPGAAVRCERDGVALIEVRAPREGTSEELCGRIVDGRYRVERVLGRGGMGTVHACRHRVVGEAVAMKVLHPGLGQAEGMLQRFIREAQLANTVRSRHVVETLDFGQLSDGGLYVVMELCEGRSLSSALRRKALDRAALLRVFLQMTDALSITHQRGIVHRDLKPANVLLARDPDDPCFVKLLDFGLSPSPTSGWTSPGRRATPCSGGARQRRRRSSLRSIAGSGISSPGVVLTSLGGVAVGVGVALDLRGARRGPTRRRPAG